MKSLLCVLFFSISLSFTGFAQNSTASLRVKGESKVFQLPDIVEFSVSISNKEMEYQISIDQNLQNVDRLKKAVKASKIESLVIKDIGQRVNEERSYVGGKSVPDGYRANYQLIIQLDAESGLIHKLLDALKNSEVIMNYSAGFKLSPELLKSVEKKMIEEAVADAMRKARVLAGASNCDLLKIQHITYGVSNDSGSPIRYMEQKSMLKTDMAGSESFTNPDAIELTDQVEISYQLQSR